MARRFCRCSDQVYCARVSTYGMTETERAEWLAEREEYERCSGSTSPG
jgi:hypothetical protein